MKIVVGLGNFGVKYAYTFHYMGFLCAECLADRLGWKFDRRECDSSIASGYIGGENAVFARPLTYMNLSGVAVKQLLAKYKAGPEDLVVMYDDIDIPKATIRVREKGSAGRELLDAGFSLHQISVRPRWESTSTQAIVKAVAEGLGVAVLPCLLVKKDIEEGTVRQIPLEQPIERDLNIIYHKSKFLTDNMQSFIDLCKKYGQPVD